MSIQVIICDYVDDSGENVISAWMSTISVRAKASINVKLEHILAQTPQKDWHKSRVAAKRKGEPDLWEVKVYSDNVQWRPLGFFGPKSGTLGTFTLLVGALEKGGKLNPPGATDEAQARKAKVTINPQKYRRIHDYK